MFGAISQFFSSAGALPLGACLTWAPGLLELHAGADALIALSLYSIPAALIYFAHKRRDFAGMWLLGLFILFLIACATTHVLGIWTLWYPAYGMDGMVNVLTAALSVPTAIAFWAVMPRVLTIRGLGRLQDENEALERRIQERTNELNRLNAQLQNEIKERNALVEQLLEAHTTLSAIIDASPQAIVTLGLDRKVSSWNAAAESIFGYPASEMLGIDSVPKIAAGYESESRAMMEPIFAGKVVPRVEARRRRKDGEEIYLRHSLAPFRDPNGAVTGIVVISEDITRYKHAQVALVEREARMRSILETVPDAIIVIDSNGVIESFSPAAERLFGWKEAEVAGENVKMMMPSPYQESHDGYLSRYAEGRIALGRRKDGSTFPIELAVGEVLLQGSPRFTGFVRDITERQTTEKRLQDLQSELMHVSRLNAMGQMGAALAHELNQPLAAITNYLQASQNMIARQLGTVPPRITEAMDKALGQVMRAGDIIRRLREFVTVGKTDRHPEPINKIVEEASALALIGAKSGNVTIQMELDPALPPVRMDKIQIQQVVVNLVRNAVEAMSDVARRDLTIRTALDASGNILVTVRDTGPGLSEAVASRLFQPFVTSKSSGMGVGLSICSSIVEAHGGTIWGRTNTDVGTTFGFTLPFVGN